MIFTCPAIFYALLFFAPVARPCDNGNTARRKTLPKKDQIHPERFIFMGAAKNSKPIFL
jgi:hypothetical protein